MTHHTNPIETTSKRGNETETTTKTPVVVETGGSSAPPRSKPSTKASSRSGVTTATTTTSSTTATTVNQQGINPNPILEPTPTPTKAQKNTNVRFAFGTSTAATGSSSNATGRSNESHMQENWIECWQTKTVEISLGFEFYLCPVLDWSNDKLPSVVHYKSMNSPNFDCESLPPDMIRLKIEIGPSIIMLYGTFLKRLW